MFKLKYKNNEGGFLCYGNKKLTVGDFYRYNYIPCPLSTIEAGALIQFDRSSPAKKANSYKAFYALLRSMALSAGKDFGFIIHEKSITVEKRRFLWDKVLDSNVDLKCFITKGNHSNKIRKETKGITDRESEESYMAITVYYKKQVSKKV